MYIFYLFRFYFFYIFCFSKYIQLPVEIFQNAYRTTAKVQQNIQQKISSLKSSASQSDIGVQSSGRDVTMHGIQHLQTIQQRNDLINSGLYLCSEA